MPDLLNAAANVRIDLTMSEAKPRLLLLRGRRTGGADLLAALAEKYDVIDADPDEGLRRLRTERFDAVLSESGDYLALERGLVEHQSTVLLNALGEGVCLADNDGRIVWSNLRFSAYDDQTRARIGAVCRQALAIRAPDPGSSLTSTAAVRRFEVASADGTRFYEVVVSAVASSELPGSVPEPAATQASANRKHAAAVVWEITQARRRQQRQAAIDRAGEELVRLDAEAIRKMHTGERLRVLEQKIIKFAHELLHFDHFAIRLIDERSSKLELVMSKGLPSSAMEVELFARAEGNGISGRVASSGKSYICVDTTTDPLYVTGIEGCRSSLTVPLRLHDKVIGIFNVESNQTAAFTEEDRSFAELFATHVALALHMLNLLVVERSGAAEALGSNVEGELAEPLGDLAQVAARLKQAAASDPAIVRLVEMVTADVDSIKRRLKDVAAGPRNILGAERALSDASLDPILAGKRVLVVDDEPRIRQVIRDVLRARGAEVVVCESGESAISVLAGHSEARPAAGPGNERPMGPGPSPTAPGAQFDLLVSDIKLPDKTGYEIFAAAKHANPNLPVILMTGFGYDPHHSIVRASQEGLSCVLFKPFQAERLIEEVHKALAPKK
jgi:two-component system, sensor histidine kinase SagS